MSNRVDMCCCCGFEMEDPKEHCFVKFRFQVPGLGVAEQYLTAIVCGKCAKESDDPAVFPVIEALINTRIIRIEQSGMLFTPEKRADE